MQRGTLQTPSLTFLLATGSGETGERNVWIWSPLLVIIYRDHHQESREIKRGRVQQCAREIVTEEETCGNILLQVVHRAALCPAGVVHHDDEGGAEVQAGVRRGAGGLDHQVGWGVGTYT